MAKTRKGKQRREARRADKELIKKADATLTKKKKTTTPDVGPSTFNTPTTEQKTTRIDARPAQSKALKETLGAEKYDVTVAQNAARTPETVSSTISGGDPKTETTRNIVEKSTNYNEAAGAEGVGDALKEQIDQVNSDIEKSEFALDAAEKEKALQEGNRNTEAGVGSYEGDGSVIGAEAKAGTGGYDITEEEFARISDLHRRQNAAEKAATPSVAIENMGIDHYYPKQKDFVTSNWTGRYMGSRQIVAATGGLYPEGIVDARARALEKKAKAKIESQEKYWKLTSTAPQYDEHYKEFGMNILGKYFDASGGDVQGLLTGNSKLAQEFKREMYDFEARGKNLLDIDTSTKALIEKMNKGEEYIPPPVIKAMYDFRSSASNMDDYMTGKSIGDEDVRRISNTLRSYQNFTPLANDQLEVMKSLGANELPFAAGADFNNPEFAANAQAAIEETKHRDYDTFTKVTSKFFDIGEVEDIVRDLYDKNNLYEGANKKDYEEQIQNGVRFFMANLPDKIDIEQKMQANKSLGWAQHAERVRQNKIRNKRFDEYSTTMLEDIDNELHTPEMKGGAISAIAGSTNPAMRKDRLINFYSKQNKTATDVGGFVSAKIPTKGVSIESATANELKVIGQNGRMTTVSKELANREKYWLDLNKSGVANKDPRKEQAAKEIKELRYLKNLGAGTVEHHVGGRSAGYGVLDSETNSLTPMEFAKGEVNDSDLRNLVHYSGNVGIPTGRYDKDGKEIVEKSNYSYMRSYNTSDIGVTRSMADQEGSQEKRTSLYKGGEQYTTGESDYYGGSQPSPTNYTDHGGNQ